MHNQQRQHANLLCHDEFERRDWHVFGQCVDAINGHAAPSTTAAPSSAAAPSAPKCATDLHGNFAKCAKRRAGQLAKPIERELLRRNKLPVVHRTVASLTYSN